MKETGDSCEIIDTFDELKNLARTIKNEKTIGVDLEADSMYHFKEKVCLIQLATQNINVVIDPLQIEDLSPLNPIFKNRGLRKIFHGADYDVRSLYRDFNISINNLFDTELASRFLGYSETSLEAVLKNKFDVTLDKKFQRKDWSKRPLPKEMISYAAKDARYLLPLAQELTEELIKLGRQRWVQEECEYLSKVRANTNGTGSLYLSLKGAGKLDPRSLAVLETLLQYRRKMAQKKDRPLFRIFGSRSLLDLAEKKPLNPRQLEKTRALSSKQINMYGRGVLAAIKQAMQSEPKDLPVYPRQKSPRVPLVVAGRIKALRNWRDTQAEKLVLDPALICTKALMSAVAQQKPLRPSDLNSIKEMKNWQKKEFGQDIVQVMKNVR
ncbi:MAG: ribonuclease D [bacterium]|nr:ribonuclease D [bacterium]